MRIHDALTQAGKQIDTVPVSISLRIIELFSAGLYSSPTKAVEELVANSYDARASRVTVHLPDSLDSPDAVLWVVDDGESMNVEEFHDLWQIGASPKTGLAREEGDRKQIGKFGIGKLATYVLANDLTFITLKDNKYLAISMDYTQVRSHSHDTLLLGVRELTEEEARTLLIPLLDRMKARKERQFLFGEKASKTWTIAALTEFKSFALNLKEGRLKWVLRTALPLSPAFKLWFNGTRLESSKSDRVPRYRATIGVSDEAASALGHTVSTKNGVPAIRIEGLGEISGTIELYEDPLTVGKSELVGRSHGIFVMVRKRLLNLDDGLFGLPQLSHGPFSRFRMLIDADGLDTYIRSTRETVTDAEPVTQLRKYIAAKFNEARSEYNKWLKETTKVPLRDKFSRSSSTVGKAPLSRALAAVLSKQAPELWLSSLGDIQEGERENLLIELLSAESDLGSLFSSVELRPTGTTEPIASYSLKDRRVVINQLHPFYANYSDQFTNPEPFEILVISDILLEANLRESGLDPGDVRDVLERRDRFLRQLVYEKQLSAPVIGDLLRESADDEDQLEEAVYQALNSLGLIVVKIGGTGKPDGIADAPVGVGVEGDSKASYRISYEVKSTGKTAIKAKDANVGGLTTHRKRYQADHILLVAPGYEGQYLTDSQINSQAVEHGVTLILVEDLARLVLAASSRQLGFKRLKSLFEDCRSVAETSAWIDHMVAEQTQPAPFPEILKTIWEHQIESSNPVTIAAVAVTLPSPHRNMKHPELRELIRVLVRMVPGYVSLSTDDVIVLENRPDRILRELRLQAESLPDGMRSALYRAVYEVDDDGH